MLVVLPLIGNLCSFLHLSPLRALWPHCRGAFATPLRQAGASAWSPAPPAFAGTPRFVGFLSPAVPTPANTQCPRYSPVPLGIFHGFQFAFPCNTRLDKEIGVCQAKGIKGITKFLLPWGTNMFPSHLRRTGSAKDPPGFILMNINGLSMGTSCLRPHGGDRISCSSPGVPTPGWVPPQFCFAASFSPVWFLHP